MMQSRANLIEPRGRRGAARSRRARRSGWAWNRGRRRSSTRWTRARASMPPGMATRTLKSMASASAGSCSSATRPRNGTTSSLTRDLVRDEAARRDRRFGRLSACPARSSTSGSPPSSASAATGATPTSWRCCSRALSTPPSTGWCATRCTPTFGAVRSTTRPGSDLARSRRGVPIAAAGARRAVGLIVMTCELLPAGAAFDAIADAFDSRFDPWLSVAAQRRAVRAGIAGDLSGRIAPARDWRRHRH